MQIKTTMRHYLIISYLLERPLSKSQEISIGEDVENKKPFFPLLVSWYTMEDSMEVPQEIKTMIELSYDPENPPRHIPKGNKNRISKRYVHSHVHCSIIHNGQDMEIACFH